MSERIEGVKKHINKLIKFGLGEKQILGMMERDEAFKKHKDNMKYIVMDVIEECPNYGLIQKIVRSDLVTDQQGEENQIKILDYINRNIGKIHKDRLLKLFDPKYDVHSKIYVAEYDYRPYDSGLLIKNIDGTHSFNTYKPPFWQEDHFYSKGENEVTAKALPVMYDKFFKHLVNNDKPSYEYLIKWLSHGLSGRNYCILTTIGAPGVGKGVLGEVMRRLFGTDNFYAGSDRVFKGTFNSQIADRRLVYCDEIYIKNKEEEDKLKLVVNDFIEIEKKGIDAREIHNYASFYISSNNMDSISLTADDRRFSILELTDIKLTKILNDSQIKDLFLDENIEQLAGFLWNYETKAEEMSQVFISERTEEVRASSLKEWEEYFVFKFCKDNPGKQMEIFEAGEIIKEYFGYNTRVGRERFKSLSKKYPKSFKVSRVNIKGTQTWIIKIGNAA